MSNGSVHVTVDTRAVAAEVSRLRGDINQVAGEVRGVSNNIHILQAELLAQIAVTIDRINAVRSEVSRGIEAAAQAKIVESASEIFGRVGIITSSARRIMQQYHKSVIRCGRIWEKFDRLNDEVKTSYHKDIRRLGKYIFELWDNHCQKAEDLIQKQHTGFFTNIRKSVEQIRKNRERNLEELLTWVKEKLAHFLGQRHHFHQSISMITARTLDAPPDKIAIPMITVKKAGFEYTQIKIGHEVVPGENKDIGYCLKETDIFKTYRSDYSNLDRSIPWRNMTPAEMKRLEHNLGKLLEKKLVSKEYHELLLQGLKKNPPQVTGEFELTRAGDEISQSLHIDLEKTGNRQVEIKLEEEALIVDGIEEEPGEVEGVKQPVEDMKIYEIKLDDEESDDDEDDDYEEDEEYIESKKERES
jgi:hypothetical protein